MSKLWIEDITRLFDTKYFLPTTSLSLTDNLNAISRLALIASILVSMYKPLLGISTFIVCIITILAIYYSSLTKEKMTHIDLTYPPTKSRFCNDAVPLTYDEEYFSQNQLLRGSAIPKTLIPPIIPQPSHDLNHWKTSDLVVDSRINDSTNYDAYAAGYVGDQFDFNKGYSGYVVPKNKTRISRSEQLRTSTMQPGVFQTSDFSEPINALAGISQQKQFQPMTISDNAYGVKYSVDENVDMFPQYSKEEYTKLPNVTVLQSRYDTFDPRFTGYADNNRSYVDPVTGATKYFYDDINAITMPNYISRNNVDIYPWAPQYGSGINGSLSESVGRGDGYKQLANNAFMESQLKQRTELQERLMRKRNAEMWQRRIAPIHTMG